MPIQPPSRDNIKVGYISQFDGYVQGLTIEEANNYEKMSPGTTFVFVNGDNEVKYLSITDVNALTTNDLKRKDPCDVSPKPCGAPTLNFFGGGGIGAKANPIIDLDGNIIAVDIIDGGYAYTSPPRIQVIDPCNNGSGAVLETELLFNSAGKNTGRVRRVLVRDSGTGYLPPGQTVPQYPALIKLTDVIVTNPGINHNCGVDQVVIEPKNGTTLTYDCNPFGKINSVKVNTGGNYTSLPTIFMDTETGVNAQFIPVFEVIRDPLVPEVAGPGEVVQVYDLVGLQINGYLNGKPYYGNVFFDNGVKYAGVRNTGVRVYDTLQESVTGVSERVTTTITPTETTAEEVQTAEQTTATSTVTRSTGSRQSAPARTSTTTTTTTTSTPAPAPSPSPSPPPSPPSGGGGYGGY